MPLVNVQAGRGIFMASSDQEVSSRFVPVLRALLNTDPEVEMADILSFNLTQTDAHSPRLMNAPDLSTKLK